ncbi:MAG: N-acetylmuramic acid 6-phosphate etherase [Bacteroidales bacterium]|nr:N-acetylmuramic acid 6-phosphate etherase [Bacteroidales bacterium]
MKTTEQSSNYDNLEMMPTRDLLEGINREDHLVADAVQKALPQIELLVDGIVSRVREGGRIFYIGAGTSGRLGVVDASEIPPTYGVRDLFIGFIAGGPGAMFSAVEGAEDNPDGAWRDLEPLKPTAKDTLVGIAASGTTPYVLGGIRKAREEGLLTACITCNSEAPVADAAEIPIVAVVGPEFVTGSTRMKAATAQKMILNMISTATMIRLGRVKGNKMFDMQLSNAKLVDRGTRMIVEAAGLSYEDAKKALLKYGSVRAALKEL